MGILERLTRLLDLPDHLNRRLDRLEHRMTSAEQAYTEAWEKFDRAQSDGFAALSTRIAELVSAAQSSGDESLLRAAARVDAARDSLAAGFAQFRATDDTPNTPDGVVPPVINPETPPVKDTDPSATDGLPTDAQTVVDDPAVPTPADES